MKIQIVIVKFLVLGALFIISNQNLHLGVLQEREIFLNSYLDWMTDIAGRLADMTGNIVKLGWIPK